MCNLVEVKNGYFIILCLHEIIHCSQLLCIHLKPISCGTVSVHNESKQSKYCANRRTYIHIYNINVKQMINFFWFSEPAVADIRVYTFCICREYIVHINDILFSI